MAIKKIVIVGLGLMGGSLAAACRVSYPKAEVFGVSRNAQALRKAKTKKWIHKGATKLSRESLVGADLIILCTPVDTLVDYLKKLDGLLARPALVTDVGSVKSKVCLFAAKKKWKHCRFIGAHPMVGSHKRGIDAVETGLYQTGFTFLIKPKSKKTAEYSRIKSFWKKISGEVFEVKAQDHDRIVGDISHLPHLAATCLMLSVSNASLKFSAKGFKDTTRVAAGHPSIWAPIFRENQTAVLRSIRAFKKELTRLEKALKTSQRPKTLETLLRKSSSLRNQISF